LISGLAAALLLAAALPAPAMASSSEPLQPPLVGRDGPETDACSALGKVYRLGATGEAQLPVRAAPGPGTMETDRLEPGTLVWLCDADGDWQGIVYPSGKYQELGDCRVGTPVAQPQTYAGPCRHGWVAGANIELIAG
jgi:hypothetical protein